MYNTIEDNIRAYSLCNGDADEINPQMAQYRIDRIKTHTCRPTGWPHICQIIGYLRHNVRCTFTTTTGEHYLCLSQRLSRCSVILS